MLHMSLKNVSSVALESTIRQVSILPTKMFSENANTFSGISFKTEHRDDHNALLLHKAWLLHGLPKADFKPFLSILALSTKHRAKIVTCHVNEVLHCQHLEHKD